MRILSSLVVCFWFFQDGDFCFWKAGNSSGYALSPHPASSMSRERERERERHTHTHTHSALKEAPGLFFGWGEVHTRAVGHGHVSSCGGTSSLWVCF